MDNLILDNSIFKISNYEIDEVFGVYIDADYSLSTGHMCYLPAKNQIILSINDNKNKSNIASHLDEIDKYKDHCCYMIVDLENLQTTCYCESEGVPYDLFEGPDHEIWSIIGYSKTALIRVVCLPIGDRQNIDQCKQMLSVAEHIFMDGDKVLSYTDRTFNNKKPTKLGEYKFSKDKQFRSVKRVKIKEPLVSRCLNNEEGIHAFSTIGENVRLHRLLDDKGVAIKEREVYVKGIFLDAYFEKNSPVINWRNHINEEVTPRGGTIYHVDNPSEVFYAVCGTDGELIEEKKLFEMVDPCRIYSIHSIKLHNDTYALTFTYGNDDEAISGGNGWCVVKSGELKECWLQQRDRKSYMDLVTEKKIIFDMENVILRDLKGCGNSYVICFDGTRNNENRNRAALMINKLS